MKRLLFILATLMVITATGCKKDAKPIDCMATLPGEWHCLPEGIDAEVYAAFEESGSFDLYQKVGEGRYRHYTGTWTPARYRHPRAEKHADHLRKTGSCWALRAG